MICRGHIRASKGALKFFRWLTVVCENWHLSQILHFVFISAAISMGQEVKNLLRAQSKYGLMGSSAKTGKFYFRGSQEHFLHKSAIWDRTPPPTHLMQSTCVWEGLRVPNLQMEFNYLDSFKCYGIFSDFIVPHVVLIIPTLSPSSPHHPHSLQKVPMWSPWLWSQWSPPHVVPIIPTSSLFIPTSSPRSPHHPQPPDTHPTHPAGMGAPNQ